MVAFGWPIILILNAVLIILLGHICNLENPKR